ncbi:hypothetical protein [Inconstantimicrobium porci]|uniref:hypothetical protein n=1 Tax=Inconstantimicrobium porci TaxID=2652291 RepID=UPI002409FA46|nr:hypothetical protein [Inconstantimicrobium porci]MDD6771567.1 hypothetical protein [Inconstantimicrobium porci]
MYIGLLAMMGLILGTICYIKNPFHFKNKVTSIIVLLTIIIMCSTLGVFLNTKYPHKSKINTSNKQSVKVETCSICGGRMTCSVCGASGMYCEKASYGSGSSHFCGKHWANVVEWHEGK